MIPCKHVFCIKCARENADKCIKYVGIYIQKKKKNYFLFKKKRNSCRQAVERIEESMHGHIFICTYGKSTLNSQIFENQIQTPSKIACGRSYMSARDLNAHIQHRHLVQQQVEDSQFINNNPTRANLITIMTAPVKNDVHQHVHLMQPALLPSPQQHQFNPMSPIISQQQQQQHQSLMPSILELHHQTKRPFDFNIKSQMGPPSNNFNQPSSFY
jgi:hypothetical protein